jgi:hypothetical protein
MGSEVITLECEVIVPRTHRNDKQDLDPGFWLNTDEWVSNPQIRRASLAAQGLLFELIVLSYTAPPGLPTTAVEIARRIGCDSAEVSGLLQDLERLGLVTRGEEGVCLSRKLRNCHVRATPEDN